MGGSGRELEGVGVSGSELGSRREWGSWREWGGVGGSGEGVGWSGRELEGVDVSGSEWG